MTARWFTWMTPAAFAVAFVATFLVALHTDFGLRADAAAIRRVGDGHTLALERAGARALDTIDVASIVVAVALLAAWAMARRRPWRAVAAVASVALSIATAEIVKHGLAHVPNALPAGRPATFPSGHAAVAASVGLALVLAAPPLLRPLCALVGAAYAAGIALSLVVLAWHYPSDTVASFCISGFWTSVVAAVAGAHPRRPTLRFAGVVVAVVGTTVALVVAATLASRHPEALEAVRSRTALVAVAAACGVVSLATFSIVAPVVEESG